MLSGRTGRSVAFALAAAALYALSTPFSKVLLADVAPNMMAALLYLGAGAGMTALSLAGGVRGGAGEVRGRPLERTDAPYVVAMVALDVAAPLLLMAGLSLSSAESVSLLNNFEIVATALIARLVFGERVGGRVAVGIGVISLACVLLSWDAGAWGFSAGSLLTLAACLCWGFENNCTNRLSDCDPVHVVIIKGWGSGAGALVVTLCAGDALPALVDAGLALLLGFVSYGLSIACYVRAQRDLGAARTSAFYAVNPFIGSALAFALFRTPLAPTFVLALVLMVVGTWLVAPRDPSASRPPA
ncbi:MAG TPA: DMT family transporter [Candidatus Olsenella pullicola]|nr:DMT family transporter [Candidatus Olsenella pullicola]